MGKLGDNIRFLRKEKGLTQDGLGELLTPKMQKSAVFKWEKGEVENVKQTHLLQMCNIFGVQIGELLGVENPKVAESLDTDTIFGHKLRYYANNLNSTGKHKLLEYLEDLNKIEEYTNGK